MSAERGTRVAVCGSMRSATSAVMPSGMAPSAFGISTSTRYVRVAAAADFETKRTRPEHFLAGDQAHPPVAPTLMPPRLRSAASTTASIGSSAMICAISLPAMEKA